MIAKTYTCSLLGIDAILVIRLVNNTANCHLDVARRPTSAVCPAPVGGRAAEGAPLNGC